MALLQTIDDPVAAVDEAQRLAVLTALDLLDTPAEVEFDTVVRIAGQLLDCPIALVSLVDDRRQWFKARCGLDVDETSRDVAFCPYAIRNNALFVVPDATRDPRFASNPLVLGEPYVRFYAGIPLRVPPPGGGRTAVVGTLCVIDTKPRALSDGEAETLRRLGQIVETLIDARTSAAVALVLAETHRADAARIAQQHLQLRQAERIAEIGSWRMTLADERLEWSDHVFAIHGLLPNQLPSLAAALDFYPPQARAEVSAAIARTLATGDPFDVELDFVAVTGARKRVRSMGERETVDGAPVALIGVIQDVTKRHALEQALRRSANNDALTGIANRAGFNDAIDGAVTRSRRDDQPLALVLIDLDGFKAINDTHGHQAGDELLQGVAHRLQMPYLNGCFPARLGGDEFVLILDRPEDCAGIERIVERLLSALKRPIDIGRGSVAVSGTLGIAWLADDMMASDLLHAADCALYEAKRAGKGVARTYAPDRHVHAAAV